jgi:hypothetical protein
MQQIIEPFTLKSMVFDDDKNCGDFKHEVSETTGTLNSYLKFWDVPK